MKEKNSKDTPHKMTDDEWIGVVTKAICIQLTKEDLRQLVKTLKNSDFVLMIDENIENEVTIHKTSSEAIIIDEDRPHRQVKFPDRLRKRFIQHVEKLSQGRA